MIDVAEPSSDHKNKKKGKKEYFEVAIYNVEGMRQDTKFTRYIYYILYTKSYLIDFRICVKMF